MKKVLVATLVVVSILVVAWAGYVFVVGDATIPFVNYGDSNIGGESESEDPGDGNIRSDGVIDSTRGTGGLSDGSSGGDESDGDVSSDSDCDIIKVAYSLQNFNNDVVCTEYYNGKCISLSADCSVQVYNLDDAFSGEFEIKYALLDSERNELEAKTLSKNVIAGKYELMSLSFTRDDANGVDEDSTCFFSILNIPEKKVCN